MLFENTAKLIITGTHTLQTNINQPKINLIAVGGNGGKGGNGGNGGDGVTGYRGNDATRYSNGTNGGRGGRGGNGGDGTSGENSGNGGNITVKVKNDDLALLFAINRHDTFAGLPGKAGRGGQGGSGGMGGSGGSSYSWTEIKHRTENYYVLNYNFGIREKKTRTVPYTVYHKNQGGSRGPTGNCGNSGKNGYSDGKCGYDGQFKYVIIDNEGNYLKNFSERYELIITNPLLKPYNFSGIFEPNMNIDIIYTFSNKAKKMQMPKESIPVRMNITGAKSLNTIEINGGLLAGQNVTNESKPLKIKVDPRKTKICELPYQNTVNFSANAINTRLNLNYANSCSENIIIQYPVHIPHIQNTYVITTNDKAQILIHVCNIGNITFGNKENSRNVQIKINLQNDSIVPFTDLDLSSLDIIPYYENYNRVVFTHDLKNFEKKSTANITALIGFKENIDPCKHANFVVDLNLTPVNYIPDLDINEPLELIQSVPIKLQLTPIYYQADGKNAVLIINSETNHYEISFWSDLLKQICGCQKISFWNTSFYGFCPKGELPQFYKELEGGIAVFLNNSYNQGEKNINHYSFQNMSTEALIFGARNNASSLVIGHCEYKNITRSNTNLNNILNNILNTSGKNINHESIDDFLKKLKNKNGQTAGKKIASIESGYDIIKVPLYEEFLCYKKEISIQKSITECYNQLKESFPTRHYRIWEYQTNIPDINYKYGTIAVQRLPDVLCNELSFFPEDENKLHIPEQLNKIEITKLCIKTLSFTTKTKRFFETLNTDISLDIFNSIFVDIMEELNMIYTTRKRGQYLWGYFWNNSEDFEQDFVKLNEFISQLKDNNDKFSNSANEQSILNIINMVNEIEEYIEKNKKCYDCFPSLFSGNPRHSIFKTVTNYCNKITIILQKIQIQIQK